MIIQPYDKKHLEAVVRLSLRAWAPVFESIEDAMDAELYQEFYPDWRVTQKESVESTCQASDNHVWLAMEDSVVAGFVAVKLHAESRLGEIHMIAVDPGFQRRGIAAALTDHAADWMKEAGMSVAMVETGDDPGHAPARSVYESRGFRLFPVARYFKKL
jgi:GNAT superfamily N-acetyltransferase